MTVNPIYICVENRISSVANDKCVKKPFSNSKHCKPKHQWWGSMLNF